MEITAANFFRQKYIVPIPFLVGILLFLLPFVEIKCNGQPFAENTGLGLAIGTNYKVSGEMQSLTNPFGEKKNNHEINDSRNRGKMYPVALIALILGIVGLAVSFTNTPARLTALIGLIAAILLIVLLIQIKSDVRDDSKSSSGAADDIGNNVVVTAEFTAWYFLSVLSFLAAAVFSYLKGESFVNKQPPVNAPQVPINNPGVQSEFPTSPEESEMER